MKLLFLFFCAKPVFTMETPALYTDAEKIEHLRYQLRTVRNELRRIERERENALFTIKSLEDDINALLEKSRKAEAPAPRTQAPKEVQAPKSAKPAPAKRAPTKPAATQPASAPVEEVTVPDPRGPVVCGLPFPPSPFAAVFQNNTCVSTGVCAEGRSWSRELGAPRAPRGWYHFCFLHPHSPSP